MHEAAGEGKGLQMHGGSDKGELGPASSCVLLWVHPSAGNGPLVCSGAHCIALGVLWVGLPAHSLPWRGSAVQEALSHASRCAAGCPEETRGTAEVPTASPGYPRCLEHGSIALCLTFTPGLNPVQDLLATVMKARGDHLLGPY